MKCKKCGALLDQDSVFCTSCGAKVDEEAEQSVPAAAADVRVEEPPVSVSGASKKPRISAAKVVGLLVGTILILIGISRVLSAGTSISPTSFGGDFYTYTYRGIVAVSEQLASIQASLGWVIVAIGAAIDVQALRR